MQIYSKSQQKITKKCFISQPILIWFALSGRAKFGRGDRGEVGHFSYARKDSL